MTPPHESDDLTARAVAEARRRTPDGMPEVPDDEVAKLFVTQHIRFGLARRELYRAIRASLPAPLRRWLGG